MDGVGEPEDDPVRSCNLFSAIAKPGRRRPHGLERPARRGGTLDRRLPEPDLAPRLALARQAPPRGWASLRPWQGALLLGGDGGGDDLRRRRDLLDRPGG